jgi:hypothetical protein
MATNALLSDTSSKQLSKNASVSLTGTERKALLTGSAINVVLHGEVVSTIPRVLLTTTSGFAHSKLSKHPDATAITLPDKLTKEAVQHIISYLKKKVCHTRRFFPL